MEGIMPKIKLLTSMAGIDFSHNAGDVIDANEAEALRFISAGIAEPVEEPKVERATPKRFTRKAVKDE
jgi:hypothetical protein